MTSRPDPARDIPYTPATAAAPLATALHFPETYAALVSGQGLLESSFLGYEPAPPEVEAALPRRGVDPRDRAKWILHARSAL